ncbi:MAG: ferrous iron transport protein B [Planctomycetota bacterium]|jgi:ferrous iron transport protein B
MKVNQNPEAQGKVVLLGNLNVGKTALFNRICGASARTANVPGTSVELGRGLFRSKGKSLELIDTPGISSLRPESEDEIISRDLLLKEKIDVIAQVVDGKNIRKGLLLTSQLCEYGIPLVFDINMMDEARQRGIRIDQQALSQILSVNVTATIATEGEGIGEFIQAFTSPRLPTPLVKFSPRIEEELEKVEGILRRRDGANRALAVRLLCRDAGVEAHIRDRMGEGTLREIEEVTASLEKEYAVPLATVVARSRAQWADEVMAQVVEVVPPARLPFAETVMSLCRRPLTGIPIALVLLFLVYLFVGKLGAEVLVELLEGKLFRERLIPGLDNLLVPLGSEFIRNMFVGDFGLVSLGLALDLGIVLPVLFTFFIAFGLLEESGYVSNLSILLNRSMKRVGLTGKGVLPMVLGFSCITMAVLSTRMLEKRRERIIATLLLVLGIPCAPLFGAMLAVVAPHSFWAPLFIFAVVFGQILLVGLVVHRILPGHRSDFIMELPPLRIPNLKNIVYRAFYRSRRFVIEAVPLFLAGSFILFLLDEVGFLQRIHEGTKPVISGLLGLPAETTETFIMTLVRREAGAAHLKVLAAGGLLNGRQIVVALLVMITFSPCVNAALVVWKDLGLRVALAIHAFVVFWAVFVGTVTNLFLGAIGATF